MASNFDFLADKFPSLANLGELAEKYCYSDANSCLIKLGMLGESIVNLMYIYDGVQEPIDNKATNRIFVLEREGLLTSDLCDVLHALRKNRNKAAHEIYGDTEKCKALLEMAYGLSEWFMQTYGDWQYQHRDYVLPLSEQEKAAVIAKPEDDEAKEKALWEQTAKIAAKAQKVSKAARKQQALKMASQRVKSEAETRVLIDEQLRKVGWEADTTVLKYSKGTRPLKNRNMAIAEWPTTSSVSKEGRADYALFVDKKLYAIVEAKAEHVSVAAVIDSQGKEYPSHIRPEDEEYVLSQWDKYKVPFTFATNGRPYLRQFEQMSGTWFV